MSCCWGWTTVLFTLNVHSLTMILRIVFKAITYSSLLRDSVTRKWKIKMFQSKPKIVMKIAYLTDGKNQQSSLTYCRQHRVLLERDIPCLVCRCCWHTCSLPDVRSARWWYEWHLVHSSGQLASCAHMPWRAALQHKLDIYPYTTSNVASICPLLSLSSRTL